MAFFTGWAAKLGTALVGLIPGAHAILLRKSDDTLDIWGSDGSGAALVSSVGGATSALQTALNALAGTIAEGDYLVSVTATTFDPPLRGLVNNGTAGKITVKAYGDTVAKEIYLAQGGQYSLTRIKEVTAIAAGMDVVGTR